MKNIIFIIKYLLITVTLFSVSALAKEEKNLVVTLKPQITTSPLSDSKYEIDLEYLMPYLENVTVVEDPSLKPNINKKFNKTSNKKGSNFIKNFIIDSKDNRYVVGFEKKSITLANTEDIVFVSGLAKERFYQYFFVTPNFSYYHPDTGEYLGSDISIIGTAKLINRSKLSSLKIEYVKSPIKTGTFVIPSKSLTIPSTVQAIEPKEKLNGYVLSAIPYLGNIGTAANNVVILSLGARDGVKVGHLLKIKNKDLMLNDPYSSQKTHKISINSSKGEVLIYNVFDKLCFGLVLNNTEEIKLLDRVANI